MNEDITTIYTASSPTGEVFYVGSTNQTLVKRSAGHIKQVKSGKHRNKAFIAKCLEIGLDRVLFETLALCPTYDRNRLEYACMDAMEAEGHPLVNIIKSSKYWYRFVPRKKKPSRPLGKIVLKVAGNYASLAFHEILQSKHLCLDRLEAVAMIRKLLPDIHEMYRPAIETQLRIVEAFHAMTIKQQHILSLHLRYPTLRRYVLDLKKSQ